MTDSIQKKIAQYVDESEQIIKEEQQKSEQAVKESVDAARQGKLQDAKRSLKKIKQLHTPPTRMEFDDKILNFTKLVEHVDKTSKAAQDTLVGHFSHLKSITQYGLSRLEAALDVLERNGLLHEDEYNTSFKRVAAYQENMMRIMSLPPKERIVEVKLWNEDKDHKRIKMESVGIIEYLLHNPDKLPMNERLTLAQSAELPTEIIQLIEGSEVMEKKGVEEKAAEAKEDKG